MQLLQQVVIRTHPSCGKGYLCPSGPRLHLCDLICLWTGPEVSQTRVMAKSVHRPSPTPHTRTPPSACRQPSTARHPTFPSHRWLPPLKQKACPASLQTLRWIARRTLPHGVTQVGGLSSARAGSASIIPLPHTTDCLLSPRHVGARERTHGLRPHSDLLEAAVV